MITRLEKLCLRAERLRRTALALRTALWAGAVCGLAGSIAVVAARSLGWPWEAAWGVYLAAAGPVAAALGAFALSGRGIIHAAVALEEAHGLKTRLSSALAFSTVATAGGPGSEFAQAIIRDAAARLDPVRPGRVVRWRLGWPCLACALAMGMFAGVTYAYPELDILGQRETLQRIQRQADSREIEARKLERLAEELRAKLPGPQSEAAPLSVSRELDKLADALRSPQLEQTDAMLNVSDLQQNLEAERDSLGDGQPKLDPAVLKDLETEIAKALARAMLNKKFGEASELAHETAEDLEDGSFPEPLAQPLGEDLARLANALQSGKALAESLSEAGRRLERGEKPQAGRSLERLSQQLEDLARGEDRRRELAQAAEALQEAQRELGRSGEEAAEVNPSSQTGEMAEQSREEAGAEASAEPAGEGQAGEELQGEQAGEESEEGAEGQAGEASDAAQQGEQSGEQEQSQQSNSGQMGETSEGQQGGEQQGQQQGQQEQGEGGEQEGQQQGQQQQQGQGEGQQQGQQGMAQTDEQGAGRDWGKGTTNLDRGEYEVGDAKEEARQAAERKRAEEEFMRLYAEKSIQANSFDTRVTGQYGRGEDVGWRNVDAKVTRQSPSAPQADLFLETRSREKQSLDAQDITLDVKDAVRRYFDSIAEPRP